MEIDGVFMIVVDEESHNQLQPLAGSTLGCVVGQRPGLQECLFGHELQRGV